MTKLSTRLQRLEVSARPARALEVLFYSPCLDSEAERRFQTRLADALATGARVVVGVGMNTSPPSFPAGVVVMEASQAYREVLQASGPKIPAVPFGSCSPEAAAAVYREIMLGEVQA